MTKRLQHFGFQKSPYERPSAKWICGNADAGHSCRLGPSGSGRCQAAQECEPLRSADAWTCTRPQSLGGPCGEGPGVDGRCGRAAIPCKPRRTLRSLRGRVTRWVSAATLGALALSLGSVVGLDIFYPGPTIRGHAEVGDCVNCHAAFDSRSEHWLLAAFRPNDPVADSKKCLACHDKGRDALYPHSLAVAKLAEQTKAVRQQPQSTRSPFLLSISEQLFERAEETMAALACATCHKDHKGEIFNPTMVSNQRCQSCHKVKFTSLGQGHPAFGDYPYTRRSRLAFDHNKHFRKNFSDAKIDEPPKSCATCHLTDPSGSFMLAKPFEQTCVACHGKDIEGEGVAGPKGIAVFSIPGLDTDTLAERGLDIGEWPQLALADALTPFTRILLAAEPRIAVDLDRIAGLDLQDLTKSTDGELAAVQRVAWAIKELLFDFTISSADTIQARLERPLELKMDRAAMGQLLGHIPLDVVRAARRSWFPKLKQEVLRYRERKAAFLHDGAEFESRPALALGVGRAQLVQIVLATPDGSIASDVIDSLGLGPILRGAIGLPGQGARENAGNRILLAQAEDGSLLDKKSLRIDDLDQLLEEDAAADNSIFKAAPRSRAKPQKAKSRKSQPPAAPDQAEAPGPPEPAPAEPSTVSSTDDGSDEPLDPNLDPEVWARLGGWFRLGDTLFYRPTEHRDSFMRAWLDISAALYGTKAREDGARILAVFRKKETPGKCTKCHSIDRLESGRLKVNWSPFAPDPHQQSFTTFNHTAHFSLVEKKGCVTCHELDGKAEFAEGYKDFNAATFASNFAPMDRTVCATCHVDESAGEDCVLCHRYHIGEFPITPVRTVIADLPDNSVQAASERRTLGDVNKEPSKGPASVQFIAGKTPTLVERAADKALAIARAGGETAGALSATSPTGGADSSARAAIPKAAGTKDLADIALQLSSVRSVEAAKEESLRLKIAFSELLGGKDLFVHRVDIAKRGIFYRVLVRPFPDPAMAKNMCDRFKNLEQDCLVMHLDLSIGKNLGAKDAAQKLR